MKRLFACFLLAAAAAAIAMAAEVTGKWTGTRRGRGRQSLRLSGAHPKWDGHHRNGGTGREPAIPIQAGKIEGNKITLEVAPNEGSLYHMELILDGEHIKGDVTAKRDDQTMTAKLDVARAR